MTKSIMNYIKVWQNTPNKTDVLICSRDRNFDLLWSAIKSDSERKREERRKAVEAGNVPIFKHTLYETPKQAFNAYAETYNVDEGVDNLDHLEHVENIFNDLSDWLFVDTRPRDVIDKSQKEYDSLAHRGPFWLYYECLRCQETYWRYHEENNIDDLMRDWDDSKIISFFMDWFYRNRVDFKHLYD